LDFEHKSGLSEWVCGVQIDNASGQVVYSTNSTRLGVTLPPLVGTQTVQLTLEDVNLGGGKYFVNASLMDTAGRHLHDIPQATSFDVPDNEFAAGTLYARPEMTTLR